MNGETFTVAGRPAFIMWPEESKRAKPQPWVMYAPTLAGTFDLVQSLRIVGNLVDNAVKYSNPGGSVQLAAEEHDDVVEITVVDQGVGIPARDIDRVFERFYRVDRARSRELGGTGLGLSIVKHLANAFGGTVGIGLQLQQVGL